MKVLSLIVFIAVLFEINCLKIINPSNLGVYQLLLISFDGFGGLYLDEFLKENPNSNFQAFINDGIRAEYMKPSFPR